jgi:hypothetical protein
MLRPVHSTFEVALTRQPPLLPPAQVIVVLVMTLNLKLRTDMYAGQTAMSAI